MIMSTGLLIFTIVHVIISLVGIGSGFVVIYGFLTAQRLDRWTGVFLAFTILTSVTGFFFPSERITPAHAVGVLSLLVLGAALMAPYPNHLPGPCRTTYFMCAMLAHFFN